MVAKTRLFTASTPIIAIVIGLLALASRNEQMAHATPGGVQALETRIAALEAQLANYQRLVQLVDTNTDGITDKVSIDNIKLGTAEIDDATIYEAEIGNGIYYNAEIGTAIIYNHRLGTPF